MALSHPRTGVIGAGISGLTASKMLKDYGVAHTTFEASDRIGGNWAFGNRNGHSSAYRSLHIDTSKHRLSFKDFPVPDHFPTFPHHSDIKAYLDAYAEAFGLLDAIEFNNAVVHARRAARRGWEIEDAAGGYRHFDLLVVGNGHHWDPRYPDFPGAFTGETIHSHHYIDPQTPLPLTGKRILVVGLGNSAADITVELSSKSLQNRVTLSTRSSAWIVPKYIAGRPGDKYWRTTPHLPLSWQRKALQLVAPALGTDPTMYGLPPGRHSAAERFGRPATAGLPGRDHRGSAVTGGRPGPGGAVGGSSFSGSHVIRVAAGRNDIAGVIAMTPLTSGLAASRAAVAHRDVASALRWTVAGVKSRVAVAAGRAPTLMPLAARPGQPGALALDGAFESYLAIAGPTWRNEVDSAIGMELVRIRTTRSAKRLRCPLLVQIADFDRFVPADSVARTAVHGRAAVHHYPCDHFDVWPGHDWFEPAYDHQLAFLTRVLTAGTASELR